MAGSIDYLGYFLLGVTLIHLALHIEIIVLVTQLYNCSPFRYFILTSLIGWTVEKLSLLLSVLTIISILEICYVIHGLYHRLLYYGLCTITTDSNFILTPTADSGFLLNFELRYWVVSWIPKCLIYLPWFVKKISELLWFYLLWNTLFHYW